MFNSFFEDMGGMPGGMPGGMGGGPQEDADTEAFYKTLGIEKDANPTQIKKAFRKQAMKHHPDKGGDPEKFKEISKAHEVLADPEKRALYDKYGEKGLEAGGGGGGGGAHDIFAQMFGGGGGGGNRGPRKGKDVQFKLNVQLEDLCNGATKSLRLTKNIVCKGCEGKGGRGVVKCQACKGRGVRMVIRQLGPGMIQQMQAQCDACDGEGEIIPPSGRCKECRGAKVIEAKTTLKVNINKGMSSGSKVVFRGEAHQTPGIEPGDVVVILDCKEHPIFKRKGKNLFIKKKITLLEALTGFQFSLEHLDGRTLLVQSDPGTVYEDGSIKKISDEGMPMESNPTQTGNLYIEFEVVFPTSVTDGQKKAFCELLPKPEAEDMALDGEDVEDVELVDVDMQEERRRMQQEQQRGQYDEDDDEGGPQQAQCRTQ